MSDSSVTPTPGTATKSITMWVLLAAAVGAMLLWSNGRHSAAGEKFVGWKLQPLTGVSQPLVAEETQGKVVLINFWGTWCPPCREEFPHIEELAHHYANN